jgi:hypothetical protein
VSGKIIDCFSYNGEKELLSLRLSILNNYVDEFWVLWGTHTFKGNLKDQSLRPKKSDFGKASDKVKIIEVPNRSEIKSPWHREFYQKSYLGPLKDRWNDRTSKNLIFCCDLDEVWNPRDLSYLSMKVSKSLFGFVPFYLDNYHFKLNYKCFSGPEQFIAGPYVVRSGGLATMFTRLELRLIAQRNGHYKADSEDTHGWHWSYLSNDPNFIINKVKDFSHSEPEVLSSLQLAITERVRKNMGLLSPKKGEYWGITEFDDIGIGNLDLDFFRINDYVLPVDRHSVRLDCEEYVHVRKNAVMRILSLLIRLLAFQKLKFRLKWSELMTDQRG